MPAEKAQPTYRHHKPTGQAVATIDGRDHYLGKHGTPESRQNYDRLMAEWFARGRQLPPTITEVYSVGQIALAYLEYADGYYVRRDGTPTSEPVCIRAALKDLLGLYSRLPAAEFSPLKLLSVRETMIARGLRHSVINKQILRLRRIFKWAVEREMAPPAVCQGLCAVAGLQRGRLGVKPSEKVPPVPEPTIDATIAHLSEQVEAMVRLQKLAAMRPGEVCSMRTGEINTKPTASGNWMYTPSIHKMSYRGRQRVIPLGPDAQAILRPRLKADLQAFIFCPADAVEERYRKAADACKGKSKRGRPRRGGRKPGDHYTTQSYLRAIQRACDRAFELPAELAALEAEVRAWVNKWTWEHKCRPRHKDYPAELRAKDAKIDVYRAAHRWHSHQLRHNAADTIRDRFGEEASQAVLGHSKPDTTRIYLTRDLAKAEQAMAELG